MPPLVPSSTFQAANHSKSTLPSSNSETGAHQTTTALSRNNQLQQVPASFVEYCDVCCKQLIVMFQASKHWTISESGAVIGPSAAAIATAAAEQAVLDSSLLLFDSKIWGDATFSSPSKTGVSACKVLRLCFISHAACCFFSQTSTISGGRFYDDIFSLIPKGYSTPALSTLVPHKVSRERLALSWFDAV